MASVAPGRWPTPTLAVIMTSGLSPGINMALHLVARAALRRASARSTTPHPVRPGAAGLTSDGEDGASQREGADRRLTLVRNATLILELEGRRLLVDPMLDDAGARPAVENTDNDRRNPLVPLPFPAADVVADIDAVLVTHLHRDHFDDAAARFLPRTVPVFCQPEDDSRLRELGLAARAVADHVEFDGLRISRTSGQHGAGEVAKALAPVSGFVIDDVYIAGDTIWCADVEDAIGRHRLRVAVVNGSAARFVDSEPLVMTTADIREVVRRVPLVIVIHLEAINHSVESRAFVRQRVPEALVPEDGETVILD
jgi:L-ascorbate metabolism protein UlaG (beta-lactamase superfamily)